LGDKIVEAMNSLGWDIAPLTTKTGMGSLKRILPAAMPSRWQIVSPSSG